MDLATEFMENFSQGITQGINVCKVGQIADIDLTTMKASVNILTQYNDVDNSSTDYPLLINVPVALIQAGDFYIRPPYKAGDKVIVLFADSDIDNVLLSGAKSESNSFRQHDIADGIIVGSFNSFNQSLSSDNTEDLLISNKDNSTKVILKKDGDIIIEGKNILLGENATEGVPLGNQLKTWLDSHIHDDIGQPPASASPAPSEVVKV